MCTRNHMQRKQVTQIHAVVVEGQPSSLVFTSKFRVLAILKKFKSQYSWKLDMM